MICLLFNLLYYSVTHGCLTDVIANDRIDCHPEPYNQNKCEAVGCAWCTDVADNIAKCFLNVTSNFHGKPRFARFNVDSMFVSKISSNKMLG